MKCEKCGNSMELNPNSVFVCTFCEHTQEGLLKFEWNLEANGMQEVLGWDILGLRDNIVKYIKASAVVKKLPGDDYWVELRKRMKEDVLYQKIFAQSLNTVLGNTRFADMNIMKSLIVMHYQEEIDALCTNNLVHITFKVFTLFLDKLEDVLVLSFMDNLMAFYCRFQNQMFLQQMQLKKQEKNKNRLVEAASMQDIKRFTKKFPN